MHNVTIQSEIEFNSDQIQSSSFPCTSHHEYIKNASSYLFSVAFLFKIPQISTIFNDHKKNKICSNCDLTEFHVDAAWVTYAASYEYTPLFFLLFITWLFHPRA